MLPLTHGKDSRHAIDREHGHKSLRSASDSGPLRALGLLGPSAFSTLLAFKRMNDNSAFRFHDRSDESEFHSAKAAVMM